MIKKLQTRLRNWRTGYKGQLPTTLDHDLLVMQASTYFRLPPTTVAAHFATYRKVHEDHQYASKFGERKTFSFEEAFLFYLLAYYLKPERVVEIGVQYGKSTRRILDSLAVLQLPTVVTCFDIADDLQFASHSEVDLRVHDVTHDFAQTVLQEIAPTLIYLDARPYGLLKNVIGEFVNWSRFQPAALLIHDCSPHLFNPKMRVGQNDYTAISSETGVWERHALSAVFGAPNQQLDDLVTSHHHLRIFETPHGLAVITSNVALHQIKDTGQPKDSQS